MNKKILTILIATVSLFSTQAFAEKSEFYLTNFGNGGWHNESSFKNIGIANKTEYEFGYSTGTSIGYNFDQIRFEAEAAYRQNNIDKNTIKGLTLSKGKGNISYKSLMANIYYDIPVIEDISLYLGIGAGIAEEKINNSIIASPSITITNYKSTRAVAAWQSMIGLSYHFNKNIIISTGYRLFSVPNKVKGLKLIPGNQIMNNKIQIQDAYINNLEVGIRYNF